MKLLCPTDFSESARRAADVAAALALKLKLPLKLHHSATHTVMGELPVITLIQEQAREALEAEANRLRSLGVEVTTDLQFGWPVDDILRSVSQEAPELIVMGSVGGGKAGRWLIGSVAERVAEHAPVPTLVVRQPASLLAWLEQGEALKVLCGVDFTVSADAALLAVKKLGKIGPCQVHAGYVEWPHDWPWPTPEGYVDTGGEDWEATQAAHLKDLEDRVGGLMEGMPTTLHVRGTGGRLDYEFVRLADELHSGLLVVGTHQRRGLQRLKGPSFSRGTLAHAGGNVMCVPLKAFNPPFRPVAVQRVLVATDFSESGNEALRHACGLVGKGGELHLLHVTAPEHKPNPLIGGMPHRDDSAVVAAERAADEAKLRALLPQESGWLPATIQVHVVAHHDVAKAICETAALARANVICVGTRGLGGVAAAVLGSVAQAVIAQSKVPVLAVPAPQK